MSNGTEERRTRVLYRGDHNKTEEGYDFVNVIVAKDVFRGKCLKFGGDTVAYVNMATGRECFEHRRREIALTEKR
jgi:hypothetical protein